jgi:hypothetical protein
MTVPQEATELEAARRVEVNVRKTTPIPNVHGMEIFVFTMPPPFPVNSARQPR